MQCVLPNTMLKKCPSEHNTQKVSFRTQYSKSVLPNTILKKRPSEHMMLCVLYGNTGKFKIRSETYPYPKGEHNGAVSPKYASILNTGGPLLTLFFKILK